MLNNFVIALREGFEAALIVGILLAYLTKSGRVTLKKSVWVGVGSAIIFSLAFGGILTITSSNLSERHEEIFAGLTSLSAVALVTWMVFWMKRIARSMRGDLEEKASLALSGGAMALTAFASVAREGIETSLFVYSSFNVVGTAVDSVFGLILGFAAAIVLGAGVYRGTMKFNMRAFFAISGTALLIVVADILFKGIGDLQAVGWLPNGNVFALTVTALYLITTLPLYLANTIKPTKKSETLVHTA
jgi:high-affinity iron transporter